MMTTYQVEGKFGIERLYTLTVTSSRTIAGITEAYVKRYGPVTEINVKVLEFTDGKRAAAND